METIFLVYVDHENVMRIKQFRVQLLSVLLRAKQITDAFGRNPIHLKKVIAVTATREKARALVNALDGLAALQ